ncbi:MAG: energy-coupling factor transporter transmembrane component T [Firmicutes bacterium]|nr:energy-coupling factor transporter transmembrane component T [Bacillota bacterium]
MNEFKNYHPIVNFLYFVAVIAFTMIFMNPVCLAISLVSGLVYSIMLGGAKSLRFNLVYLLPLMLVTAMVNPAFSHEGVTILCYLPSGNPLTLESILYGIAAAVMLASVICRFACLNRVMTSDKFIYLSGRIMPSLSLVLSMVLRFVPKFKEQIKAVSDAQKCIGRDTSSGSIVQRGKNGIKILSIMVTRSMENAIDTADSMKSRGYGLPGRTAYSNFRFNGRDVRALCYILALSACVICGALRGGLRFRFFPDMRGEKVNFYGVLAAAAYFLLSFMPVIIEIREEIKWKKLKSKI